MHNNLLISNSLVRIGKAVHSLDDKALTVIGYRHDNSNIPTIEIAHHPICEKMIANGSAVYFMHIGVHRFGQFELEGCRVVWKELDLSRFH